ncbi:MAG: helix-turn-helix domain-containing protein [Bacillota bacterium]|jgi:excisionase family DNA binding protein
MKDQQLMTLKEVARYLRLSERHLRRYLADGKIKGIKLDYAWRFRPSDVEAFLRKRERGGPGHGEEE